MRLSDLFTDPSDGRLSHTKLWSHIGLATMTIVFLHRAFYGNIQDMELEYWAYGLFVTSPNLIGKFLSFRFGNTNITSNKNEV